MAFTRRSEVVLGVVAVGADSLFLSQATHVVWCATNEPDLKDSVTIDRVGTSHLRQSLYLQEMQFSPDSRHLAVVSRGRLSCIELETGKHWTISPRREVVTSFAWRGNDTIGYVAYSKFRGQYKSTMDRWILMQQIHEPSPKRRAVYEARDVSTHVVHRSRSFMDLLLEVWSPTGRYVAFLSPPHEGRFQLLDLVKGTVRSIGQAEGRLIGATWRPDESALLCVNSKEAWLVDPVTGDTTDLTAAMMEAFRLESVVTRIESRGTVDGLYFIVNDLYLGGYLVRAEPWEIIPVGQRLAERLDLSVGEERKFLPHLRPLPIPGWLLADAYGTAYAVNYEGRRFVHLDGGRLACSPDGRLLARVDRDDELVIEDFTSHQALLPADADNPVEDATQW